MKQTAVEWYYDQTVIEGKTNYYELLEQAKQMEREQRVDDYNVGYADATCRYPNSAFEHVDGKK